MNNRSTWLDIEVLRYALNRLSQPLSLEKSPLLDTPLVTYKLCEENRSDSRDNRAYALAQLLKESIERVAIPAPGKDLERAEMYSHTLHGRYILGLPRVEVAHQLGMERGLRTYDRIHLSALEQLASELASVEAFAVASTSSRQKIQQPNNLPRREHFIDRDKLARVIDALREESRQWLVVIHGSAGMGKTSIALEAAYRCLEARWFDGAIWVDARPQKLAVQGIVDLSDYLLSIDDLYEAVGEVLGRSTSKSAGEQKEKRVYETLKAGRYLMVIDNFETIADEVKADLGRFLMNRYRFPDTCKVVITSRHREIDEGREVKVEGLTYQEALVLIRATANEFDLPEALSASEPTLKRLWLDTDGCPLAMKWIIGQVNSRGETLESALDKLQNAEFGSPLLEYCFRGSFELLSDNAKQILMCLTVLPSPLTRVSIAAITSIDPVAVNDEITTLRSMSLVKDAKPNRFTVLQLIRDFSQRELEPSAEHCEDWFLAAAAHHYIDFCQRHLRDYEALELERENLLLLVRWCCDRGRWDETIQLVQAISPFLYDSGYWVDYDSITDRAILACESEGNLGARVNFLIRNKSFIRYALKEHEQALGYAQTGLELARDLRSERHIGAALYILGLISREKEDYLAARDYFQQAFDIFDAVGELEKAHQAEGSLSVVLRRMGDLGGAERLVLSHLANAVENGDLKEVAIARCRLGSIEYDRRHLTTARDHFLEALRLDGKLGRSVSAAHNYQKLALVAFAAGDLEDAYAYALKSCALFRRFGSAVEVDEVEQIIVAIKSETGK